MCVRIVASLTYNFNAYAKTCQYLYKMQEINWLCYVNIYLK
jgi:hypothetical protein